MTTASDTMHGAVDKATAKFHAHLDTCERCRNRPHDPCATGADLLTAAGILAAESDDRRHVRRFERRRWRRGTRSAAAYARPV